MKKKMDYFFRSAILIFIIFFSFSIYLGDPGLNYFSTQIQIEKPLNSQLLMNTTLSDQFNSTKAYKNIQTQLDFGYRIPGSNENLECASWINSEMQKYGESALYNFTIGDIECHNIISRVNPNKSQIVIFAAHFDSRAVAEKDSNESLRNTPIMGANDGGSGVAVMMEIARIIALSKINWNISFWFIFFDAEDQGLNNGISGINGWNWCEGSTYMMKDMKKNPNIYFRETQSLKTINSFILFDMVGGPDLQFISESHDNDELRESVFRIGQSLEYTNEFPLDGHEYTIQDDHVPFANEGIPTLDLIIKFWDINSGWPYHHTQGDNIAHISEESLQITGRTILQFVYETYNPEIGFIKKFTSENTFFSSPFVIGAGILIIGISIAAILKKSASKRY